MNTLLKWLFEQVKNQVHFSDVQVFDGTNQITFWYHNEQYVFKMTKGNGSNS